MAATDPQLPAGAPRRGRGVAAAGLFALVLAAFAPAGAAAQSSCGSYDFATPFAAAFFAAKPLEEAQRASEVILGQPDARCHQERVIAALEPALGGRAGYKAAATSPRAQEMLGLDGPVLGVLFADMLLPSGSTVSAAAGARLIFEQDLMVRVADPAINRARTREEALAHLDAVVPMIELGDLMVPRGTRMTGPLLQAMNAGARQAVVGEPIPLPPDETAADALAGISATLTRNGATLATATGEALLGHPLDAVLFIVEQARARGWTLEAGDLLSLGAMSGLEPAAAGDVVTARYAGIPGADGPVELSVTFE